MGAFYGSVHLRTQDREAVRQVLEQITGEHRSRFLLGPALCGWVAVYPEGNGQDDRVAADIAGRFPGEVLYVLVHDDDIFAYSYFRDGELVDEYNSRPDYFEEVPPEVKEQFQGRPELLAHLMAPGKAMEELLELLSPATTEGVVFASELLGHFADLLGLSNAATAYEYLQNGESYDIVGWDEFQHVPDLSAERARKGEAEARIERAKERLHAEGLLLLEKAAPVARSGLPVGQPVSCPDREGSGFLVVWRPLGQTAHPVPLERFGPPWTNSGDAGLPLEVTPGLIESSSSGRYLAVSSFGQEEKIQLWDLDEQALTAEVEPPLYLMWAVFSPDEKFLVMLGKGEGTGEGAVARVRSGRPVSSFRVNHAQRAIVHPSGVVVVATWLGIFAFVDLSSGRLLQTLFVGGQQTSNQGNERVTALECSPDGRFVFCATDHGMRVFAWDALRAAKERTPPPVFAVPSEPVTLETGQGTAVNHQVGAVALAYDQEGNRLLFGGWDGTVSFLDLVTGRGGTLLDPPGRPLILSLGLSRNRRSLCCTCQPAPAAQGKNRKPALLHIWDYAALEKRLNQG